jgi:hypothetical protein
VKIDRILALVCAAALVSSPVLAEGPRTGDEKPPAAQPDQPLHANLRGLIGKRVVVMLRSGADLEGTVAAVGEVLHLREIAGKEYFDAVVRLEEIAAVQFRVRTK